LNKIFQERDIWLEKELEGKNIVTKYFINGKTFSGEELKTLIELCEKEKVKFNITSDKMMIDVV